MTIAKGLGLLVALGAFLLATPAFADSVDGNWCHNDGRRFVIRGPSIETPGGKQVEGDYRRHWFSYIAPPAERGAGNTIFMNLIDENTVHLRYGDANGEPEVWVRCMPSVSALERPLSG